MKSRGALERGINNRQRQQIKGKKTDIRKFETEKWEGQKKKRRHREIIEINVSIDLMTHVIIYIACIVVTTDL